MAAGTITEEELERGLELQKETHQRLGATLIANKIITEAELIESLQMQLGIEYVDLTKVNIPTELAQVVPKNLARQYSVVPVRVDKDMLYLAMSDPTNFYAIEDVRKAVRKKVIPVIATEASIGHAIAVLYGNEGAAKAIEEMKRDASISETDQLKDNAFVSNRLDDDAVRNAPTIRLVNAIIERAVNEKASDIHLEPREESMVCRMRIDGMMRNILTVPRNLQGSVISRVKVMSGMDIAERRIPQDGRFNVKIKDKDIDLRVSTLPTVYGEKIVARLLDKSEGILSKEAIGLSGDDLKKYDRIIKCSNGVILIVGPTGSGKSSTMYTIIGELNKEEVNLVTLEDPVEYNIDGVNQVQINEKVGMSFASGLRSILRQDPDIIAVGEIRDGETAEIAMRAAVTGHVVLSTIHTNDAVGTIDRLIDIGVEPYMAATALRGIISQRLVRRICPHCKKEYEPTEEELEELGISPKDSSVEENSTKDKRMKFYRGEGCPHCFNTGYRGRIAVFEIMQVTQEVRKAVIKRADRSEIEKILHGSGFVSLRENGIRLVKEGITTASEIVRVINEDF